MAGDQPQQPVERRDDPPPRQMVEWGDESTHLSERGKGLDSMGVPAPVPAWELPGAALPQASVGDGAGPQASAQEAAPMDYDG
jgi:hypothetical protein